MEKKIIFFDIDGTLFCPELGGITHEVKTAIKNVQQQGHLCFIASGRPYGFIAQNVKDIGFDGYVLANGANVKYQNQDLEVRYMNPQKVKQLCKQLKAKNIEYILQTSSLCYMSQTNENLLNFYSHCNIDFHNLCYEYDENEVAQRTVKIEAWTKTQEEIDYLVSCLSTFSYELHPDNHSLEIYASDVSKATGIMDVINEFQLSVDDSYCFGDGPNDIEMFETVGHPIAMGNAIEIYKKESRNNLSKCYGKWCRCAIEENIFVKD